MVRSDRDSLETGLATGAIESGHCSYLKVVSNRKKMERDRRATADFSFPSHASCFYCE